MATAKALVLEGFGGPQNLHLKDVDVPEPGQGEVLVAPYLRPVNPTDVLFIGGHYGKEGFSLPRVPGSEGVARVVKNGPGASKFKEGQRVVAVQWPQFSSGGSWTTAAVLPESILYAVPDDVDDKTAAQFFINPVTVYGLLKELDIPKGGWLLQAAATSVLGRQVIQLAKHWGIKTINVVRRSDAVAELKALGADEVIATDVDDIEERVKAITGGAGTYAAIDPVGGAQAYKIIASLRKGGTYLAYGALDTNPVQLNIFDLVAGGKVAKGFIIYQWVEQPAKDEVVAAVWKLLQDKVLVPFLGEAYPLEQYQDAIERSQAAARGAKVFIEG